MIGQMKEVPILSGHGSDTCTYTTRDKTMASAGKYTTSDSGVSEQNHCMTTELVAEARPKASDKNSS